MSFYSSSKTKEENNEDNTGISELSDYIRKTFPENPPSLKDFVENYPRLTKLIDYIHSSLSSGKPLTKDGCNMIELGFRNFIQDAIKINATKAINDLIQKNPQLAPKDPMSSAKIQLELLELSRQKEAIDSMQADHAEEMEQMQESLDAAFAEKDRLLKTLNQLKLDFDDQLSKQQLEYHLLELKYEELEQKLSQTEKQKQKLSEDIKLMQDDEEDYKNSTKQLNEKISKKKDKINALQTKVRQLQNEIEDKDVEIQKIKIDYSAQQIVEFQQKLQDRIQEERDKSKTEIDKLNKIIDENNIEIGQLKQELTDHQQRVKDVSVVNEDNESKIEVYEREAQNANERIQNLQKRLENAVSDRNSALQREEDINTKYLEQKTSLENICKALNCDIEECPDTIQQIKQENSGLTSYSERYRTVAESFARFLQKLLNGDVNPEILQETKPLIRDREVKRKVMGELARLRAILRENPAMKNDIPEINMFDNFYPSEVKTEQLLDSLMMNGFPDEYCAVVALSAAAECQRKMITKLTTDLAPLRKYVPSRTNDYELGLEITRYFKPVAEAVEKSILIAKTSGGVKESIKADADILIDFVKTSSDIIRDLDNNVRAALKSPLPIEQLPSEIIARLSSLKRESQEQETILLKQSRTLSRINLESSMEYDRQAIIAQGKVDDLTRENTNLKQRIEQKDQEIQKLRESFAAAKDEKNELEDTFQAYHQNRADLEHNIRVLLNDRNRLQMLLDERSEAADRRVEEAIETERQHHTEEVKRLTKRYEEEKDALHEQIKEKNAKIATLKKKFRELAATAEDTIKKQKESINKLIKQNKENSTNITPRKEMPLLTQQIQDLTQKLDTANEEKSKLQAQLLLTSNENPCDSIGAELEKIGYFQNPWNTETIISTIHEMHETSSLTTTNQLSWDKWALSLLSKLNVPLGSTKEESLRSTISDLSTAGVDKFKLIGTLQSLRNQKKILQNPTFISNMKKTSKPSCKGVVLAALFCKTIKSKAAKTRKRELASRNKK